MNNPLNSLCPYFAMYPLDYPMGAISESNGKSILDPFCGRGTTNVAARLNGLYSVGIDSSPVAYAISSAKMVEISPEAIIGECNAILSKKTNPVVPEGEFWDMMYHPAVLSDICTLREAFLDSCESSERIALRGIILGALHGPLRADGSSSYFSNQFPRTFASKPDYSVKFWKKKGLCSPPAVDVREIIGVRARRYYSENIGPVKGFIVKGDSTDADTFRTVRENLPGRSLFDTVITSPPYHGMNTYIPDQWIRNWFVGGPPAVEYTTKGQTSGRLSRFISQISDVWKNCGDICSSGANMFVRFGEMGQKNDDPEDIVMKTFDGTGWNVKSITGAGEPKKGRRSSELFGRSTLRQYKEIDIVARLA